MIAHKDQQYVKALLNNDSVLIEEIYKKCSVQCVKFVKNNSGTLSEAKDVFQESITTLYHQAKSGLILTAPICAYLYRIYRGKWINLLNSKKRKSASINLTNLSSNGYTGITIHYTEEHSFEETREKIFMECFEKLSIEAKQLFNLRYKNKMPSKEIARQLNIADNAVNQRFSYYKQKLKDCVEKHSDFKKLK